MLLARLAGGLAAPLTQFAGLLQALPRNLAYGLKALIDKRGGAPLPETTAPPTAAAETAETAPAEAAAPAETAEAAAPAETAETAPAEAAPAEAAAPAATAEAAPAGAETETETETTQVPPAEPGTAGSDAPETS